MEQQDVAKINPNLAMSQLTFLTKPWELDQVDIPFGGINQVYGVFDPQSSMKDSVLPRREIWIRIL